MRAPKIAQKCTFWRKTPPKSQKWLWDTLGEAYKAKLWHSLALVTKKTSPPPPKKWVLGGQGGLGGAFWALFRTFLAPFFNRWSDKKDPKTKNVGKGHISIPREKGFDVAF